MTADNTPDGWLPDYIPQGEVWRQVVTHAGKYEVSSEGRVRTVPRRVVKGHGHEWLKQIILKQTPGGKDNSYRRVMLMGPKRHAYVHHLVAEAFIGPRPADCQVLHKDDNGHNNRLDNIRYGDREENDMDRYARVAARTLPPAPF